MEGFHEAIIEARAATRVLTVPYHEAILVPTSPDHGSTASACSVAVRPKALQGALAHAAGEWREHDLVGHQGVRHALRTRFRRIPFRTGSVHRLVPHPNTRRW